MIDEEKVKLMTKMAAFEKHHGQKDMNIVNYYRNDFIGFQILKAIIAATISFIAVFAIYFFYNFEMIMSDIYEMDYAEIGKKIVLVYLIIVGVYCVLCYILYAYRYSKAKKELKGFYADIRKLHNLNSENAR